MAEITVESSLLECGICFELLDETCKMLPCQHTYCQICLENTQRHEGSLRCPQCRTTVPSSIDSLPKNRILLNLIQEMKKKTPKPRNEDEELAKVITISLEEFMSQKATDLLLKHNEELQTQLALETSKQQSMIDSAKQIADEYEELVNLHLAMGQSEEESQNKQQQNMISDKEKNLASALKHLSDWFRIHNGNLSAAQKTEIQGILKDLIGLVGPHSDSTILTDTQLFLDELEAGCSSNSINDVEGSNQSTKKVRNVNDLSELIDGIERLTYMRESEQKQLFFNAAPRQIYAQPHDSYNYLQSNNQNIHAYHHMDTTHHRYNMPPIIPLPPSPQPLLSPLFQSPRPHIPINNGRGTPKNMDRFSGSRGQGSKSYSHGKVGNPFFIRSHSKLNPDDARDYNKFESKSDTNLKNENKTRNRSVASSSKYEEEQKLILPDKRDYNNFHQPIMATSHSSKQPEGYEESLQRDFGFSPSNEKKWSARSERGFKNHGRGRYYGRNPRLNDEQRDMFRKKSDDVESNVSGSTSLSYNTHHSYKNKWDTGNERGFKNHGKGRYQSRRPRSNNNHLNEPKNKSDDIGSDSSCSTSVSFGSCHSTVDNNGIEHSKYKGRSYNPNYRGKKPWRKSRRSQSLTRSIPKPIDTKNYKSNFDFPSKEDAVKLGIDVYKPLKDHVVCYAQHNGESVSIVAKCLENIYTFLEKYQDVRILRI